MTKLSVIPLMIVVGLLMTNPNRAACEGNESTTHKTVKNVFYRDEASATLTDYMKQQCRLDVYYPTNGKKFATVVWFHGGGLTGGKRYIPEPLRNQDFAVVPVSYRLYPKVKCADCLDDAAAAVAWVFRNIQSYGGDPNLIFVAGHSAGGYLDNMVGLDKEWLAKYDIDANRLAGIITFSGNAIDHIVARKEMGIGPKQPVVDKWAPLYYVRKDAPPIVLMTADREKDMLGRYEENAYMWRMLKVNGHKDTKLFEMQGTTHSGMVKPACQVLIDNVREIVARRRAEEQGLKPPPLTAAQKLGLNAPVKVPHRPAEAESRK